jgi:hypothetical protein
VFNSRGNNKISWDFLPLIFDNWLLMSLSAFRITTIIPSDGSRIAADVTSGISPASWHRDLWPIYGVASVQRRNPRSLPLGKRSKISVKKTGKPSPGRRRLARERDGGDEHVITRRTILHQNHPSRKKADRCGAGVSERREAKKRRPAERPMPSVSPNTRALQAQKGGGECCARGSDESESELR